MIAFLLAQTIAITGGTVYPVSGPKIDNATVLIRDGRIAAVGTNVAIPAGATRIDAAGKWVTPGLIESGGALGLIEITQLQSTNEAFQRTSEVAASFNVAEGINPASALIPITRIEGITTALTWPQGQLIAGQGVMIDLDGATVETMLVQGSQTAAEGCGLFALDGKIETRQARTPGDDGRRARQGEGQVVGGSHGGDPL